MVTEPQNKLEQCLDCVSQSAHRTHNCEDVYIWRLAGSIRTVMTLFKGVSFLLMYSYFKRLIKGMFPTYFFCFCKSKRLNPLDQACSAFYIVRANSAKFGLHAGNVKFSKQNEEWMSKYTHNYVYNYNCVFIHIMRKKYTDKKLWKNAIHNLGEGVVIFSTWISNIMHVSINKQLVSFQNCLGVISRLCQGKS
jgi:hypothetical protein